MSCGVEPTGVTTQNNIHIHQYGRVRGDLCVYLFCGYFSRLFFLRHELIALVLACYSKKIPISQHDITESLFLRSFIETALAQNITRLIVSRVGWLFLHLRVFEPFYQTVTVIVPKVLSEVTVENLIHREKCFPTGDGIDKHWSTMGVPLASPISFVSSPMPLSHGLPSLSLLQPHRQMPPPTSLFVSRHF